MDSQSSSHLPTIDAPVLSVSAEECQIHNISLSTLQNIWSKAEKLIRSDGHIIKVPWLHDDQARLVKSYSSPQPHLVTRNPKNEHKFCCDKNCQMFKCFSVCSHVIATAQVNGQLESYLTEINTTSKPNLTSIANQGMPNGTGRKGGIPKRKRNRNLPTIETRSVRPCLEFSPYPAVQLMGNHLSPSCVVSNPTVNILESSQNQIAVAASICVSPGTTHTISHTNTATTPSGITSFSPVATSRSSSTSFITNKKPFVLKLKTNQIKICQSCQKNYDGPNDTMGLVVAHAERHLVSNLSTGTQSLGRESNSHYHLHLLCLKKADSLFTGRNLVVPEELKPLLTAVQKMYLAACFDVIIL